MIYTEYPSKEELEKLLIRPAMDVSQLEEKVSTILRDVRERGAVAVR